VPVMVPVICLPLLTDFNSVVWFYLCSVYFSPAEGVDSRWRCIFFRVSGTSWPRLSWKEGRKRVSFLFILVLFLDGVNISCNLLAFVTWVQYRYVIITTWAWFNKGLVIKLQLFNGNQQLFQIWH